ncbi:MAG: indolepyruvate oxidoreductase subunit beta [Methanosarcinales archaeon]|jgi:indolepyruvate ferredoxin oxidoreductase beta subunit|nr:indolepyruvate oxidoreductase subunit beta [Methanosarcinales archaeon]
MSENKYFGSVPNAGKTDVKYDVVICGVGGQGAILASDILGRAAVAEGRAVQAAETHGMAQRGGSVENHVRIGSAYGSLIPKGGADLMIALEPAEAVRYAHLMKNGGVIIVNTEPVYPFTVTTGKAEYPDVDEMIEALSVSFSVKAFNASAAAKEAGGEQAANVVLIGAASHFIPLQEQTVIDCIKALVPPKFLEVNLKAFDSGKQSVSK